MRTILIDPEAQTVTELDFEGNYLDIQKTIGCRCFTVVGIDGPDQEGIFVDDEGLLHGEGFVFKFNGHPLVGKGLIMGCDNEGESIGTTLSVPVIRNQIEWLGICHFNL
jgi:hypothetical protein